MVHPPQVDHSKETYGDTQNMLFSFSPDELVFIALRHLNTLGVKAIEYRRPLYARMEMPVAVTDHTYLVPDDVLLQCQRALNKIGLLLERSYTDTSCNYLNQKRGFGGAASLFKLTKSTCGTHFRYLVLLPTSTASFLPSELLPCLLSPPPRLSQFDPDVTPAEIYVPTVPAVYASLLRIIACHPPSSMRRGQAISDFGELFEYNLLGFGCSELSCDDEVDDAVIQAALEKVRDWSRTKVFRPGQEWMGDLIGMYLEGKAMAHYLPYSTLSH